MFEVAELGRTMSAEDYDAREMPLRTELLALQRQLLDADFPVLVMVAGLSGAGRHEVVNLLHEWLDAREVTGHSFGPPTHEDAAHPPFWRYWRSLPRRGRIGVYLGHCYSSALHERFAGKTDDAELDAALARACAFERTLVADGALIVKLWLHMPERALKKRVAKLEKDKLRAWQVTKATREELRRYGRLCRLAERTLRLTNTGRAPWTIVESTDERYRNVTIAEHLAARLKAHLEERSGDTPPPVEMEPISDPVTVLDAVDLGKSIDKDDYAKKLPRWQGRLAASSRAAAAEGTNAIVVLEGWDAAGKGGSIRRMLPALDATRYRVVPISAPTEEERAHHYLWRFWKHLPSDGRITIYDRSWYGRVLVERVEGYATEPEWRRAYREINEFEEQLVEHGIVLVKVWLHLSPEEQLRRFEERQKIPYKRHKIGEEDWRNREKWPQYELAANEMVGHTSTEFAPWTLVSAESKYLGRLEVLRTVTRALEAATKR
jgi:polyphosphate:AMP phosphotransferase